jgi:hypothetical protein
VEVSECLSIFTPLLCACQLAFIAEPEPLRDSFAQIWVKQATLLAFKARAGVRVLAALAYPTFLVCGFEDNVLFDFESAFDVPLQHVVEFQNEFVEIRAFVLLSKDKDYWLEAVPKTVN